MDSAGVVYDSTFLCSECPSDLGGGVKLAYGGTVGRIVYFKIPAGVTPVSVIYQPLFSTDRAIISLQ